MNSRDSFTQVSVPQLARYRPSFIISDEHGLVFLRIWVVIVLLGRPVNGCLREQEAIARTQAADRTCLQSLPRSPVTAMTVVGQADDGHLVYKRTADPAALGKLRRLAQRLRPVRTRPGGYRPSLRRYTLVVVRGRDTCELVIYKMPAGTADLLAGGGARAYEAPQLVPLLDSLFRSIAPNKGEHAPMIERWLRR